MSKGGDTTDDLMGLFSTRAGRSRVKSTGVNSKTNSSVKKTIARSKTEVPSNSNRRNTSSLSSAIGARKTQNTSSTPISVQQAGPSLSPLGNAILRESRRELGNEFNLQGDGNTEISEAAISRAVERVLKRRAETLPDLEKANIIIHLQKDLLGWGVLQPLVDNPEVTDIHVYDYKTVVLQRGKKSEATGLHWPSAQAYSSFIDRILLKLGKSLSTQQHTVDCSFPNGIRICAVHESVCGVRGPLLTIRVPRVVKASLQSILDYEVCPPLIIDYLSALIRSGECTFIFAGETGTGKTTLMRCLATQFNQDEAIISVEDTPELNLTHPFYRSLVSRTANLEGVGEVTQQEHIKTTLRMSPTRVLLGEMRTPFAAEAFLESAQTGHVGMTTVHARNAKETLVRLESLLGRAQKSVSIDIIRQQVALAVDVVIWLLREKSTGKPRVAEIVEVGHFVEGNIQVRPMFSLIKQGKQPVWRVDSWSSGFEEVLVKEGIHLGNCPQEITLATAGGSDVQ